MATKNKYTNIDLSKYDAGYRASDAEKNAFAKKDQYASKVENWTATPYARENDLQGIIDERLNRKKFSYDLNGDVLYQQYKDNYITQGKQAMMDTMGQASAMTGGYGNSYAATVGNQTYQGYLQGLNDIVPQLYQMALDRYNAEGSELDSKYSMLSSDKSAHQTEQEMAYNKLVANRDYYANDAYNLHNTGYGEWNDNRTYDTSQYWSEYNTGYQAEQDSIANQLARDQLDETIRANEASEKLANEQFKWQKENKGTGSTGSGNVTGNGTLSISNVPDSIVSKVEGFKTDAEMGAYLDSLEGTELTPEQADTLYATYSKGIPSIEEWELVDNGGINGFLGMGKWFNNIDDNAKAKFKNGDGTYTTYTMADLSKHLQNNGYTSKEAKEYIRKLQTKLGIN